MDKCAGNTSNLFGGSIYNRNGLLILDKVQIQHNLATFGGAVMSIGSLVITDSTFYNNTANTSGGAVYVFGSILEATNSTFSGNRTGVNGFGGGILINSSNTNSILQNVTVTGNVSLGGGNGGGLYSVTYIRVVSSVIAGNTASTNSDVGGSIANLGFNILSGDPLLAPLADNGGTTRTHLPQCGSPLINAGDPNSILTTDQRGAARPIEGRVEIGAVELSRIAISPNSLTAGTVGAAYSNTLTAMCETAPYNFTIESGTLPNGLTLSNSGSLAGTPTAGGIFNFTVRVTAANGGFGMTNYALKIFSFTPAALPVGLPNVAYSQSITVTGGTAPYTFALDSGTLPSGFSVSSSGLLSGTTTQIGAFNFAVRATDSNGAFALKNYALNVGYYVINAADSGTGSLRQTILNAPIDGTISFDPAFFNQPRTISIASLLIVNKNLTINGTGANFVIIDGQNATRILNVDTATLTLSGVRLTRGNAGTGNSAGGILVNGGTLNATSIMIDNCIAGSFGGAISNAGSLTLNTSLITGNSGSGGAGISNDAGRTANINYSTVSNNTAVSGGGIGNNGTVNSFGSTFSGNTAQIGGGIYNDGTLFLINSTLSGNRSTSDKGAGI